MTAGDTEPGEFLRGEASGPVAPSTRVTFDRRELNRIFGLYGRKVAAGEWRDYAIDFLRDRAVFSVFRRASEVPIYRIEKSPKLARRQGAYSVISATGLIVRRCHELHRGLRAIDPSLSVVAGWPGAITASSPRLAPAAAASRPCRASGRTRSRHCRKCRPCGSP